METEGRSAPGGPRAWLPSRREWAWLAAFAVLYFLGARLGHVLTPKPRHFATFWPPAGLFLGALLLAPPRLRPWIAVAALPPSFAANLGLGVPPLMSVGFYASDVCAAAAGAFVVRRLAGGRPSMTRLGQVLAFIGGAALVDATIAAATGAATLAAFDGGATFVRSAWLWWQGDALGALVVGPLLLAWAPDAQRPAAPRHRLAEAAALAIAAAASAWFPFSSGGPVFLRSELVLVPTLLWAALRFGPRGATALGLLVSLLAVLRTHDGVGPFAALPSVDDRILGVQFFLALLVVIQLVVAGVVEERAHEAESRHRGEERFRALIESATDVVLTLDPAGVVTFASPAALATNGFMDTELVGTPGLDLVHPDDRPGVAASLAALAAGAPGGAARMAYRAVHRDGSWRYQEAVARNQLSNPAVRGIVVNVRDVTEQRRLEEQFQQAQKLEAIGRLAGGIAHDFNNLLVAILGYASYLEEGIREGRPSLDDLAEVRRAGERARELTSRLLSFARRQLIAPRLVDLNALVRDSEKLLCRVLGEDVVLRVALASERCMVKADPGQLEQVILNLAVNARDAMPGGGRLVIETALVGHGADGASSPAGDGAVRLTIADSGEGLSPEARAHLFEPFFTTKPAGKGTGLGLATVYGVVHQAGGTISVESEAGAGARFSILLPRAPDVPAAQELAAAPAARGGSEIVLVVEDDASVRKLVVRTLSGAGYRLLVAPDGREALDAARAAARIDLLLSDVVMPGMSGKEVAEALAPAFPDMPVLFVSGYAQDEIGERGVLGPGVHLLSKPFTPAALLARVREVLDAHGRRAAAGAGRPDREPATPAAPRPR